MNKLTIIGNLTKDPETRTIQSGSTVCSFTLAVNRRKSQNGNQPEADFFRCNAWNQLGEICQKYLTKGSKAAVVGCVSVSTYQTNDGTTRASLDVMAEDVEFLTAKTDRVIAAINNTPPHKVPVPAQQQGYTDVTDDEDLPF